MDLKVLDAGQKAKYNKLAGHLIQSWEWGQFRQKIGTVIRLGLYDKNRLITVFQLTLHKIPFTNYCVGYLPKGPFPDKELADILLKIGKEYHCALIKVEPNILASQASNKIDPRFHLSSKPYFTKYNYILDLNQTEEEILKKMHPKFRYNIKVAQKHGVVVEERDDEQGFNDYLKLYFETAKRQNYRSHNPDYHRRAWETLKKAGMAHLLIAYYQPPTTHTKLPLTAWMLFNFHNTLYYTYGGSSDEYRNVMAANLMAWEAIKLGKKLGLKKFDLWGAKDPSANPNHPYAGFSRFKSQIGAPLFEYLGTFDLILNPLVCYPFIFVDKFNWLKFLLLRLFGR